MSHSNGIISAPVSIEDVKAVLGESSNDLATLCKSNNINVWSRCKPVARAKLFIDSPINEAEFKEFTSATHNINCVRRCGMFIPWVYYGAVVNNYNNNMNTLADLLKDDNMWGNLCNSKEYYKLAGGSTEPFRLSDFNNYFHGAKKSFSWTVPENDTVKYDTVGSTTVKVIMGLYRENVSNCVLLDDILSNITEWSLWLYVNHNDKGEYIYVGNLKKSDDDLVYVYNSEILLDSTGVTYTACMFLANTTTNSLESHTRVVPLGAPGTIKTSKKDIFYGITDIRSKIRDSWTPVGAARYITNGSLYVKVKFNLEGTSNVIRQGDFTCVATLDGSSKTDIGSIYDISGNYLTQITVSDTNTIFEIRFSDLYEMDAVNIGKTLDLTVYFRGNEFSYGNLSLVIK